MANRGLGAYAGHVDRHASKGNAVVDLEFSPQDAAFRDEVRTFLARNYPPGLRQKQDNEEALTKEDYFSWHRILAARGWSAPALISLR